MHRADIKTSTGIFIEVQHSAVSDAERHSREDFYDNLIWVVDGLPFQQNFDIFHMLPDPQSAIADDLVWIKAERGLQGTISGAFWRPSENPDHAEDGSMVLMHSLRVIKQEVLAAYRGHHQYDWQRPRRTWLDATRPVYIDLGNAWLARLERYGDKRLPCIRLVAKAEFLVDVMRCKDIHDVCR